MGTTSRMSMPTLELWFSCFTKPLSTMYLKRIGGGILRVKKQTMKNCGHTVGQQASLTHLMPSMVRDVAAMLVATTHFLMPLGAG